MSVAATPVLLAFAFRPFFLLAALYAVLVILAWVGFLFAGWPLPLGWSAVHWHAHEMLYALVPAAMTGFLLTAVTNWTGAAPVRGGHLLALILLWLAGRVMMWTASWWPPMLVAVVDLAFLPAVSICFTRPLLRYRNHRNLILSAVLLLLFIGNLLMHLGFASGNTALLATGRLLGFDVIALMMAVVAGRITPAFSMNWLRLQGGNPAAVRQSQVGDNLALASLGLLALLDVLPSGSAIWPGAAALLAALLNGWRLWRWSGWLTAREPLLWILHLAYLWLVAALLLRALCSFSPALPPGLWQHALGVGAIGVLLLGVMTRVAVGHTGRPLRLQPYGLLIYLAINLSAVLRLLVILQLADYRLGVTLSGLAWILAFSLYALLYWPILSRPRPDGKAG